MSREGSESGEKAGGGGEMPVRAFGMESVTTGSRPLRIAVVGAGPAGFYTAEQLLDADLGG